MSPTLCHYPANSPAAAMHLLDRQGCVRPQSHFPESFRVWILRVDPFLPLPSPLPPRVPPHRGVTFSSWQCVWELHLLPPGHSSQRARISLWPIEFARAPSAMDETSTRENKDLEENWIKGLRREASWQVSDTKTCACKRIESQR